MFYRLLIAALFAGFISSCSSSKNGVRGKNTETILLDSIEVTASRENNYRASAPLNFDLIHTKLEVRFDYQKQQLHGKATLNMKPHFYPQKELVLDAKQFDIREVSVITSANQREALLFTYDSSQLFITLNKEYTPEDRLSIFIDYTAKPEEVKEKGSAAISSAKGLYFINPLNADTTKPTQIWTQGETEANSCWFPTIDKPNQRLTNELYITRPKRYVSLSNGILVSSISINDSLVTDYWKMDLPHAPYLVMMAIGDFAVIKDRWRDVPVDYYVERKYAPYARQIFGNTPEMMEFFSQKLGFDYPWQKYSQVVVRDYVSGAMENTSASLFGEFIQRNPRQLLDETFEDIIAHELFHQWFGDLVTCESWSNLPLNESFATYGEYLWNEYKYGREYADYKLSDDMRAYMREAERKNVDLIRFNYENKEDMFDRHSYQKGGLVLHYLRAIVGDDAFFKSLELYLRANQYKPVEIHQLRLAFEDVTGQDMNWFFNQWFLNSGHPVLDIKYSYDADSVYVKVEQKQNTDRGFLFQLPFKTDVWYEGRKETHTAVLKHKSQVFAFKATGTPLLIDADADRVVLCQKKENKITADYIFQLNNSTRYLARYEAVQKLAERQNEPAAVEALMKALHDPSFSIREFAIRQLEWEQAYADSVAPLLENMALNDKVSKVRKAALDELGSSVYAQKYSVVFEKALSDSSYEVVSAALKAYSKADADKAMERAKQLEQEENDVVVNAVSDVYAREGDAGYNTYFENKLRSATGFGKYSLLYYYANFLTRMEKDVVLAGITTIEKEGKDSVNHFITGAAKGSLKRIAKSFEEKKKKLQDDTNAEPSKTATIEKQELIGNYELIIGAVNDALGRMNKK